MSQKIGTFLLLMTPIFPPRLAINSADLCNTREMTSADKEVRLQLNILIEKCTHVKRIEKCLSEKNKMA